MINSKDGVVKQRMRVIEKIFNERRKEGPEIIEGNFSIELQVNVGRPYHDSIRIAVDQETFEKLKINNYIDIIIDLNNQSEDI